MSSIKRKPKSGKPKLLVKTIRSPAKLAKASFSRGRHLTETDPEDQRHTSASGYAIDKGGELAKVSASDAVNAVHSVVRRVPIPKLRSPTGKEQAGTRTPRHGAELPRPRTQRPKSAPQAARIKLRQAQARRAQLKNLQKTRRTAQAIGRQKAIRQAAAHGNRIRHATSKTASTAATRGIKVASRSSKLPKQAVKASVKTAKAGRTVVKSGKIAIKTLQTSAKAAKASVQTSMSIIHKAKKAAVVAAKLAAKAAIILARIAAASARAIMAILTAGGGMLLLIVIAVAVVAAILTSAFGIFFSNESADGMPMTQAIVDINTEFTNDLQARIDELSSGGSYDAVVVSYDGDYDGDSAMVNNWQDVLGVYAVKTVSDEDAGTEVITLSPEKIEELKTVFNDMNTVEINTWEEHDTTYDANDNPITTVTLHIEIRIHSMTYLEGAAHYGFDARKLEMLEELMAPEYYELFAALLNVDMYDGLSASDLTAITSNLPSGTKGAAIAEAAIAAVGTPYSKMDCSQLSRHAYAAAGVSLPRTSVEQAKYCSNNGYMIGAGELQAGDLVFWSKNSCSCGRFAEIHHVAVYIGGGKIVDASSGKGRVVLRNLWSGGNWSVWGYARPHV